MNWTTKFKSGLTYDEADALVEQYLSTIDNQESQLAVLKSFLKDSVRDSKRTRDVISELVGRAKRG